MKNKPKTQPEEVSSDLNFQLEDSQLQSLENLEDSENKTKAKPTKLIVVGLDMR